MRFAAVFLYIFLGIFKHVLVCMVSTFRRVEYGSTRYCCQGQQNRKSFFALSQFAPEILASRNGFGRPFPRQPAHYPHLGSIIYLVYLLTGFLPLSATESIDPVNRHWVNPKLIRPRNCVPKTFTAESPPATSR